MKPLLLSFMLFAPSVAMAEPLWAYVMTFNDFVNIFVDLNSIKNYGEITYYNEHWQFESGKIVKAQSS